MEVSTMPVDGQAARTETGVHEASIAQLVSGAAALSSQLVRDELKLAQVELARKGKSMAVGGGLFGGAGLLAFFGLATAIATAVLALHLVLAAWLSALIVTAALLVLAGLMALIGKRKVDRASPPMPTEALASLKVDVASFKEARKR